MAPTHSGLIRSLLTHSKLVSSNRIGGAAASPIIYVDYVSTNTEGDNNSVYTWSAQTVGPGGIAKSLDRLIVVVAYAIDDASNEGDMPVNVTVGGANATCWSYAMGGRSANETSVSIWTYADTGLVTADVVCTYIDSRIRAAIDIYNVGNVEHEAPHFISFDTGASDDQGTVVTNQIQLAPGEKGIAASTVNASSSCTWTNATEETDAGYEDGGSTYSSAHIDTGTITDSGLVTATWANSEHFTMCSAVWRQVGATPAYSTFGHQGIREVAYITGAGTGANSNPYTWDEVATGRLAGPGQQKYILLHADVEDSQNDSQPFITTDCTINGVNPGLIIARNATDGGGCSNGAFFWHHGNDTGTTLDIVFNNPAGGSGTRASYNLWAVYVDSGYAVTAHDSTSSDSGDPHIGLYTTPRSFVFFAEAGSGTGGLESIGAGLSVRSAFDMDSNDWVVTWDDGNDTGSKFNHMYGDTGARKLGVGSPGGWRSFIFAGGSNNDCHWLGTCLY